MRGLQVLTGLVAVLSARSAAERRTVKSTLSCTCCCSRRSAPVSSPCQNKFTASAKALAIPQRFASSLLLLPPYNRGRKKTTTCTFTSNVRSYITAALFKQTDFVSVIAANVRRFSLSASQVGRLPGWCFYLNGASSSQRVLSRSPVEFSVHS